MRKYTCDLSKNDVNDAMKYSLFSDGKRLRPALVYQTAKLFGKDDENIDRLAAAIEMIHTYSLIHDDLPCMDNDDMRRGKPSCHKAFGETAAVLAGDGLLNLAFETLLGGDHSEQYFKAISFIASCSGVFGMIGGQAVDVFSQKVCDEETLDFLTENKTSKLIMACVGSACIYCGGSSDKLDALLTFAENFGKAFQAADDLLDEEEDENLNFIKIFGRDGTEKRIEELNKAAKKAMTVFDNAEFFNELCDYNAARKR